MQQIVEFTGPVQKAVTNTGDLIKQWHILVFERSEQCSVEEVVGDMVGASWRNDGE